MWHETRNLPLWKGRSGHLPHCNPRHVSSCTIVSSLTASIFYLINSQPAALNALPGTTTFSTEPSFLQWVVPGTGTAAEAMVVSRKCIASAAFVGYEKLIISDGIRLAYIHDIISLNDNHTHREGNCHEVEENGFRAPVFADQRAALCTFHTYAVGLGDSNIEQMRCSGIFGAWMISMHQSHANSVWVLHRPLRRC